MDIVPEPTAETAAPVPEKKHREHSELTKIKLRIHCQYDQFITCDARKADKVAYWETRKLQYALTIGNLFIEAKKLVPHGDWGDFIQGFRHKISKRTAEKYMSLASQKANAPHGSLLDNAGTLRKAYIAAGIIKDPKEKQEPKPEPSEFVKAKGYANKLWELLTSTNDPDKMAEQIEDLIQWHTEHIEAKQKREAALNDGFETAEISTQETCGTTGD